MEITRIEHRGWSILVSQLGSKWQYTCCPPEGEPLASDRTYPTKEMAIAIGISFVDLMIPRCQLRELMDDWLEASQINSREYESADSLIAEMYQAIAPLYSYLAAAPSPPLQHPGNPHGAGHERPA